MSWNRPALISEQRNCHTPATLCDAYNKMSLIHPTVTTPIKTCVIKDFISRCSHYPQYLTDFFMQEKYRRGYPQQQRSLHKKVNINYIITTLSLPLMYRSFTQLEASIVAKYKPIFQSKKNTFSLQNYTFKVERYTFKVGRNKRIPSNYKGTPSKSQGTVSKYKRTPSKYKGAKALLQSTQVSFYPTKDSFSKKILSKHKNVPSKYNVTFGTLGTESPEPGTFSIRRVPRNWFHPNLGSGSFVPFFMRCVFSDRG